MERKPPHPSSERQLRYLIYSNNFHRRLLPRFRLFPAQILSSSCPGKNVFLPRQGLDVHSLEGPPLVLGTLGEGDAQLEQLGDDGRKVGEESVIILGVLLDVRLELAVLDERIVGRQHHERLGRLVLVLFPTALVSGVPSGDTDKSILGCFIFFLTYLLGAVPLLPLPLLVQQEGVVVVGEDGGGEGPGTLETAAIAMAAAEGVCSSERDDLLVVEAHAVEDASEVVLGLGSVRKTAVGSTGRNVLIGPAWAVGDLGAHHLLDGCDATEDPEIGVRDPWKLFCSDY